MDNCFAQKIYSGPGRRRTGLRCKDTAVFLVLSLLLAAPAARASEFQIAADSFTVANQFNISSVSYLGAMPAAPDNPALATQLATPGGLYFDGTYYKVWDRTALAWVQLTTGTVEGRVARTGDFMSGQLTTASTITVHGDAFSVGGSTLVVTGGKVGIGTTTPQVGLDVGGGIRAGSQTAVPNCNSLFEGTQRYNYSTHAQEYCDGAGWTSLPRRSAPADFSFTNQTNVYFNYTITSDAVALTGFSGPVTATCGAGCTGISRNGGAFSAFPVTGFMAGDTIAIQQTSSTSAYTMKMATVSVGGTTSGAWDVTTGAAPAAFSFTDQTNVYISSQVASNAVALTGFVGPVTATCGAGCTGISRNGGAFSGGSVSGFVAGDTIAIRQTSSGSANTMTTAVVKVGPTTSGVWSVTTMSGVFPTATAGTTFVVPAGVTSITVKAWGAGGGSFYNIVGGGGFAQATIAVTPGESLTVMVGGPGGAGNGSSGGAGGLNGGGAAGSTAWYSGGGGGYSALKRGGTFLIQAGGGGGGGGAALYKGGAGGGANGQAGLDGSQYGGGGTPTAGGAGGSGGGIAGSANTGGAGYNSGVYGGGGGGGGRFGGGGGGGSGCTSYCGGGGGGSSLVTGTATVETTGSGGTPGNNTDPYYTGSAGARGFPGLVVILY
ncbi:MAG: hypothetical protein A2X31_07005 [Elusimicrobia bacterium GWB2_63_22]|nr:MAG: hypothetical protein A2X31_07005 [Elusimicrobia bacterium GWB2_63_22]